MTAEPSALIFMDTETTGLALDDDVWEFAAIRREPDGTETEHHLFVEHDHGKVADLPPEFRADHDRRFPGDPNNAVSRRFLAGYLNNLTLDRPHIVGSVPNFDTERLAILLRAHGYEPGWHYHLIDVENLAVGYLAHQWRGYADSPDELVAAKARLVTTLPWNSDELSRAVGVEPPGDGVRHTAMGDACWARAVYDAIIGGSS